MRIDRAPNVFAVWDVNRDGELAGCRELWRVPHHDGSAITDAKALVDILEKKDVTQERLVEMEAAAREWRQRTAGYEPPGFFERAGNFLAGLALLPLSLAFFFVTMPYWIVAVAIPGFFQELRGNHDETRREMKPFLAPLEFSWDRLARAVVSSEPPGAAVVRDSPEYTLPFRNQDVDRCDSNADEA